MKAAEENIKALIRKVGQQGKFTFSIGKVSDVKDKTCTVGKYKQVRLNAIVKEMDSFVRIYPKAGSTAIVGRIEGSDNTFLVGSSEIERVLIKKGTQEFELKDGKFKIKNDDADLKKILDDTFQQLNQAIITTPTGPGQFSQVDKQKFQELKQKTDKLFL